MEKGSSVWGLHEGSVGLLNGSFWRAISAIAQMLVESVHLSWSELPLPAIVQPRAQGDTKKP